MAGITRNMYASNLTTESFSSTAKLSKNKYQNSAISIQNIEEKKYDPYEHRNVKHPNTFAGALIHIIKSCIGTGILAIPSAIANAGVIGGLVGTILVGILCTHTIHILIYASLEMCRKCEVPMLDFSETAYEVFKHGPKKVQPWANFARKFVDTALVLTGYACCAVYVVFICENVKALVDYHEPSVKDWPIQYYMLMLLVPLIICCQIRQLKQLVPFSLTANIAIIIAFLITLYYMFSGIEKINLKDRELFADISLMPLFFNTMLFAMEGISSMFPVENSITKPQFIGNCGILNVAMIFVVSLYTIMGIFGYLRFGNNVEANVIASLPINDTAAQLAKACIAIGIFFTTMLAFYVPCDITWRKLSPAVPDKYHNLAEIVLRILLVLLCTAVAASVPKLNAIISLVGAIFLSTLGLFIPAVIDTILNLGEDGNFGFVKWRLWKNILVIIVAWGALLLGSYYAVKDFSKHD